jgi:hypothetical protein
MEICPFLYLYLRKTGKSLDMAKAKFNIKQRELCDNDNVENFVDMMKKKELLKINPKKRNVERLPQDDKPVDPVLTRNVEECTEEVLRDLFCSFLGISEERLMGRVKFVCLLLNSSKDPETHEKFLIERRRIRPGRPPRKNPG